MSSEKWGSTVSEQHDELPPAPTTCPFCRSPRIAATASKKVDASAYWRCEACGEMWNVARLGARGNRYGDRSRWQRA
jgi:transposase-like protein